MPFLRNCQKLSEKVQIRLSFHATIVLERGVQTLLLPRIASVKLKHWYWKIGELQLNKLAAITKMGVGSIETILHDHLHMSKVSARWVPRLLTPNQKEQRADSCKELIKLESKDTLFFYQIVTMDETWVHHFDPEMKSSSMQWKTPSSPTPKKARLEPFE